jgi:hypothetical protein
MAQTMIMTTVGFGETDPKSRFFSRLQFFVPRKTMAES